MDQFKGHDDHIGIHVHSVPKMENIVAAGNARYFVDKLSNQTALVQY